MNPSFTPACSKSPSLAWLFTAAFASLFTVLGLLLICSPVIAEAQRDTVLVVGDSIGAGYGVPDDQNWVSLIQQQLSQARIINASISGDTSSGARQRLPKLLDHFQPDVVIIEIGGNDGLRGQPIAILKENLTAMIQRSRDAGAQVLLLGMRIPPNYGKTYTEAFHNTYYQVAREQDVALLPFLLEDIALKPELMQADRIHPNSAAQPLIVQNVMPALEQLLN